jgi:hypothetical protein
VLGVKDLLVVGLYGNIIKIENMRLLVYEGYNLTIDPMALALKPFKAIWVRDKTEKKERAISEIAYIYFMEDPRSDYQYIIDRDERSKAIKEGEGLKSTWQPDGTVKEAMKLYASFKTTSALLLEDTRALVDGYRNKLRDLTSDMSELDVKDVKELGAIIKQVPSMVKDLDEAERALAKEIAQSDKVRGAQEKSIYEDM